MHDKNPKNIHKGHRQRFRNMLVQNDWENVNEHQVLEYVLSVVIPRKDTNPLAHVLIDEFGSLAHVLDASVSDLMQISGVGETTATFLHSIPSLFKIYKQSQLAKRPLLTTASRVFAEYGKMFNHMPQEELHALSIDSSGYLISQKLIAKGSNNEVPFSQKQVLAFAIRTRAAGIILLHNHPNGELIPSPEDIQLTRLMFDNLMLNGILILDHLIVGKYDDKYFSFKKSGLLDEFDKNIRQNHLEQQKKAVQSQQFEPSPEQQFESLSQQFEISQQFEPPKIDTQQLEQRKNTKNVDYSQDVEQSNEPFSEVPHPAELFKDLPFLRDLFPPAPPKRAKQTTPQHSGTNTQSAPQDNRTNRQNIQQRNDTNVQQSNMENTQQSNEKGASNTQRKTGGTNAIFVCGAKNNPPPYSA